MYFQLHFRKHMENIKNNERGICMANHKKLTTDKKINNGLLAQAIKNGLLVDRRINVPLEVQTAFYGKDFISIDQIQSQQQIEQLFEMADVMNAVSEHKGSYKPLKEYTIVEIFFENSTRTSISFEAAGKFLGAKVIVRDGMKVFSSVTKGESLEDTIHAACQTSKCNLIVLRHHDDNSGERAVGIARRYNIPVINSGSGTQDHPTQALLDLYTIRRLLGRTDNLRVMMVGDMKYGRTNKSLAKLLAFMDPNVELIFAAPEPLKSPQEFIKDLAPKVARIEERSEFISALGEVDVVYMTRVQKERFPADEMHIYEAVKDQFIFTPEHARMMKKNSIIMHPLPRVNEINYAVDDESQAAYF